MGPPPLTRRPLLLLLAGVALAASSAAVRAGEDPDDEAAHLTYRRTYEQALLEARVRGVPLFVSRHKDF